MERLTQAEAIATANLLAGVVGKAHARQMDSPMRSAWASKLTRASSMKLNAPSWLWNSVVELAATHEAAYLQHCQQYALDKAGRASRRAS
jgi:uncharacterized protein (DUF2252 family)